MYSSVFLLSRPRPPCSTLFPYTTLFRSLAGLLRGALTELLRAIGDDEPRRRSDGRERLAHVGPRLGLAPPGQERRGVRALEADLLRALVNELIEGAVRLPAQKALVRRVPPRADVVVAGGRAPERQRVEERRQQVEADRVVSGHASRLRGDGALHRRRRYTAAR